MLFKIKNLKYDIKYRKFIMNNTALNGLFGFSSCDDLYKHVIVLRSIFKSIISYLFLTYVKCIVHVLKYKYRQLAWELLYFRDYRINDLPIPPFRGGDR